MLEFRILGPLEVVGDTGPVRLGGPKQRATLAILLLHRNTVVSIDQLADDLYAGAAPVTAVTQVQRQISELRKVLGSASVIETRAPGYVIRLSPGQLDLHQFEYKAEEASSALERREARTALDLLREALGLWRGAPLADLAYEPFARTSIERLEEIRLAALEQRIEAELALGRHATVVGELEELIVEHPLRERLRGQLMLALYRSGRQPAALDVYRKTRASLVKEFGIEPTRALQELERAILKQDPSLDLERDSTGKRAAAESQRALLVLPSDEDGLERLLAIAEPLARLPGRELIVARLIEDESGLAPISSALSTRCASLDVHARAATFTTVEAGRDAVRLATTYDVELVLLEDSNGFEETHLPDDLATTLERSPADVAILCGAAIEWEDGAGVLVPFGGSEHDWAALELGAWLAFAVRSPLRLVGSKADARRGRRDASRLLADASLAVQQVVGVEAKPLLAHPTEEGVVAAANAATLVVVGISPRWRHEGIRGIRRALLSQARPPTLLVHRGPRPSGLAPRGSHTRFTWTIEA